jgi:GNAT superfamily N-acetyltransferase
MSEPPDRSHPTRVARDAATLAVAARLLVDFNREYDEPAPTVDWLTARLERLVADGGTSVLLAGDPAVGVAVLRFRPGLWDDGLEAYLAELYVRPDRRGRGIGGAFLDDVIAHARARGATYMDLTTTTADAAARRVYASRGFDWHEGRGDGPESLYYELDLDGGAEPTRATAEPGSDQPPHRAP